MSKWICQYCKHDYFDLNLCVYHELNECSKNPKFKYTQQNEKYEYNENVVIYYNGKSIGGLLQKDIIR